MRHHRGRRHRPLPRAGALRGRGRPPPTAASATGAAALRRKLSREYAWGKVRLKTPGLYVAFVLYLYSVFICQMTVMSFSPDKTRAFLPALLGDKYVDLMVVPCVVQRRDPPRTLVVQFPTRCNRRGGEDTCTRGPIKGATSDPPVISREARTHDQRGTRLGHWRRTRSDVREDVRATSSST